MNILSIKSVCKSLWCKVVVVRLIFAKNLHDQTTWCFCTLQSTNTFKLLNTRHGRSPPSPSNKWGVFNPSADKYKQHITFSLLETDSLSWVYVYIYAVLELKLASCGPGVSFFFSFFKINIIFFYQFFLWYQNFNEILFEFTLEKKNPPKKKSLFFDPKKVTKFVQKTNKQTNTNHVSSPNLKRYLIP